MLAPTLADAQDTAAPAAAAPVELMDKDLDWAHLPPIEQLVAAYPEGPKQRAISGRSRVACKIASDYMLEACEVREETPPNLGFGQACVTLTRKMKLKAHQADPRAAPGATVIVETKFQAWN